MALRVHLGHMEPIVAFFALGLLVMTPVAAAILIRDAIIEMRAA